MHIKLVWFPCSFCFPLLPLLPWFPGSFHSTLQRMTFNSFKGVMKYACCPCNVFLIQFNTRFHASINTKIIINYFIKFIKGFIPNRGFI